MRQFIIVFRLVLTLTVALTGGGLVAVWWNSPYLVEQALNKALSDNGINLQDFSMLRPTSWSIHVGRITLTSPNVELTLSGIVINPLEFNPIDYSVNIEQVSLAIDTNKNSAANPLDWQTLMELISDNVPLLPGRGFARHVDVCTDQCRSGELSWIGRAEAVEGHFIIPDDHLLGSFLLSSKKSTISVAGYKSNLFIIEADALVDDTEELIISAKARFISDESRLHFEAAAPFNYKVDITSLNAQLEGTLPLGGLVDSTSIQQLFEGSLTLSTGLEWQVKIADTFLSSQQPIAIIAELNKGVLHSTLTSEVTIEVENALLESSTLIVAAGAQCTISVTTNCSSADLSFAGTVSSFSTAATTSSVEFSLDDGDWQLSAFVDVTVDTTRDASESDVGRGERITNLLTAGVDLAANNVSLTATTDSATIIHMNAVNLAIKHNLQSDKGELIAHAERPATELMGIVKYFDIQNIRIESGEIAFTVNLGWDLQSNANDLPFSTEFSANNLTMNVNGFGLHQGSIISTLAGWPEIQTTRPVTMTWDELDIGVPITDINLSFDLDLLPEKDRYKMTGKSLNARLFGGALKSEDYAYDLTRESGHLILELDKLELQQILALQQDEFESTGKISGSVPVHIEEGILSVSKGTITAIEPGGIIKYKPSQSVAGLVAQNEQLKVVVDTMSNFQYHSLEAALEYSPEGDLVARTSLKGSNPAFENGREIHLNVKLEENLADLLKSLRLSNEVSRNITRKAKDGVR